MHSAVHQFLRKLFRRQGASAGALAVPGTPANSRIYAIGDIHGRIDLLSRLQTMISDDLAGAQNVRSHIVFLGDYIDRGLNSKEVIDSLIEWRAGESVIHLRGNHEDMLLQFLNNENILESWRQHGGIELLYSYQVATDDVRRGTGYLEAQRALKANLPPDHLDFLLGTATSHTNGDFFFCHAGINPEVPLNEQSPEDLLWIREAFTEYSGPFEKFVIHGHTPVERPDVRSNRINIDTGAYVTGVLTCLVLEEQGYRFLAT